MAIWSIRMLISSQVFHLIADTMLPPLSIMPAKEAGTGAGLRPTVMFSGMAVMLPTMSASPRRFRLWFPWTSRLLRGPVTAGMMLRRSGNAARGRSSQFQS